MSELVKGKKKHNWNKCIFNFY